MEKTRINVIEIGQQKPPALSRSIFGLFSNKRPDSHQLPEEFSTPKKKLYLKSYKMKRGVPHWITTYLPVHAMEIYGWDSNTQEIIREFVEKRGGQVKSFIVSWTDEP